MRNRILAIGLATVATLGTAPGAEAASVSVLDQSYTVSSAGGTSVNPLSLSGPGTVTVTLSDIPWPAALGSISFELLSASGHVIGAMSNFGTQTFAVQSGGSLYGLAYGVAAPSTSGALGYGSYGLSVSFVPGTVVPLPAAGWLLASGLAGFWMVRRRNAAGNLRLPSKCKTNALALPLLAG